MPTASDDVTIDRAAGTYTITVSTGAQEANSVTCAEKLNLTGGSLTVSGTLQIGDTMTLSGGTLADATVMSTGGAELQLAYYTTASGTLDGVTLDADLSSTGSNTSTYFVVTNGLTINGTATLGLTHRLRFDGTQTLDGSGELVLSSIYNQIYPYNGGTLTIGPSMTVHGRGSVGDSPTGDPILNQGTIRADVSGQTLTVQGSSLTNQGSLESTTGNVTIGGPLSTSGSVSVGGGTTMTANDTFVQTTGSTTVLASALLDVTAFGLDLQGGTLGGFGTVEGDVDNTGGSAAPGASAGTLTNDGIYTQGGSASFDVELGGSDPADYDRLVVTGSPSLDGTLNVSLIDGFFPAPGDSFVIMTFPSATGTFAAINFPSIPNAIAKIEYNADNVTLWAVPALAAADIELAEGDAGTTVFEFTASLSGAIDREVTVDYATSDGSATLANNDYVANSGTLTFPPNVTSQTVAVDVNGDLTAEGDETFFVDFSNPSYFGAIGDAQAQGTILNDDGLPSITINDVALAEGDAGTTAFSFTVSISNPSAQEITVDWATADGTATTANNDYVSDSGTLTFPAKTTDDQTITVQVNGDTKLESDEVFVVNLSNPSNAIIADNQGEGTILNDDGVPSLSINDVSVLEGDAGTVDAVFTVSLSELAGVDVTVDWATADGTATVANGDYAADSGTLTFPAKSTDAQTITVKVNGDLMLESDETFLVNLSNPSNATIADNQGEGTIQNDDGLPSLSIDDVSVVEGDAGTVDAVFTVRLSELAGVEVTVDWATADGSATVADGDYVADNGTLSIPAKTDSGTITVAINGDVMSESDETFLVNLSNPSNATIADNQGEGTILNDDGSTGVDDVAVTEFALTGIVPNPMLGHTSIEYTLPRESRARLAVLDLQGRTVALLRDGVQGPGRHQLAWSGRGDDGALPAGIYFLRFEAGGVKVTKRLMILR